MKRITFFILSALMCLSVSAEDGSQLWLRYTLAGTAQITAPRGSATIDIAARELSDHWQGKRLTLIINKSLPDGDGYRDCMALTRFPPIPTSDCSMVLMPCCAFRKSAGIRCVLL
jgi:hypothetical protein